jgi:hypothetical protein
MTALAMPSLAPVMRFLMSTQAQKAAVQPVSLVATRTRGLPHLANVVSSFCVKMDKNMRGLRQEMSQLRDEVLLTSPPPEPRQVQVADSAHDFEVAASSQLRARTRWFRG